VKILVRASEPFESTACNPLGPDRAPHRIWTWSDGGWVLLKFLDDGAILASTSPGLRATLIGEGERVVVRVERAATFSEGDVERA